MRGNSGAAPLKVLDEQGLATGGKRWRFIPLRKRLQHTSARPAALPSLDFEANLTDIAPDDTSFSHFQATLSTEADTNITATYNAYHHTVAPISLSLPLLFRNRKRVLDETLLALEASTRSGAEATPSISKCLAALSRDLGPQMFHPFFPQVVKAIAHVFTTDREKNDPSGRAAPMVSEQSILWDPETSIVPLFATLAEITKLLLKQLASDPRRTCIDLCPLLSNHNRRVREMTAEACLGYLVRKTRDSGSLKELTSALIMGAVPKPASHVNEAHFIDGLAASLFESLRVPHGRLQARASEVVKYVIQSLGTWDGVDEQALEKENKVLSVVAHCFRDIARHLTHEGDTRTLSDLLVAEGELALRAKNALRTGSVLFLLRNWIRAAGRAFCATVGRQGINLISGVLSECLDTFTDDSRIVYEAFGSVLLLALTDFSDYPHEALQQIASILELASTCFGRNGILAALYALLFTPELDFTPVPATLLLKALSPFYERLTQVCMASDPEIPLLASVLLCRRMRKGSRKGARDPVSLSEFRVPSIQVLIKEMACSAESEDGDLKNERRKFGDTRTGKLITVEFLCYFRVPGLTEWFSNLLDSFESWTSPGFPAVLTAFSHNFTERTEDDVNRSSSCTSDLHKKIRALVKDVLFNGSLQSAPLLDALFVYVRAFPSTVRDWLLEYQDKTQTLFSVLSNGLSSGSGDVRLNSAALLSSLYPLLSQRSNRLPSRTTFDAVDVIVERLRLSSEITSGGSFEGIYDSFELLLSVPNSLEAIAGNERVLRELVRTSQSQSFHNGMVETLINFSIGLLRTPLKVLWDGARDLWCVMANIDCATAMRLALKYMGESETKLLSTVNDITLGKFGDNELLAGTGVSTSEEIMVGAELSKSTSNRHPTKIDKQGYTPCDSAVLRSSHKRSNHSQGLEWNPYEWQNSDIRQSLHAHCDCQTREQTEDQETLDSATSLVQLLKVLSHEPQHTLQHRSKLIRSFLDLNSGSCDGKGLSQVLSSFTILLERMGGLKCCETDINLEKRMRDCLLLNLTKTHVPLQLATIRCLCLSRSPFLKPHRDSFIRLLSEKTFREEVTLLTESLFKRHEWSVNAAKFSDEERDVCDVLTRISFSKIRGKQKKLESKRSVVLSFLVAKVPWKLSMPMITSLALAPIEAEISKIEASERLEIPACNNDNCSFPTSSVQKGILFSIEAVVKHCGRAIPEDSWRRLGLGTTLLLRNASRGSVGQAVRSRALAVLADMVKLRSSESEFLVEQVFRAVRKADFDTAEYTGSTGVPALMCYVDAFMNSAAEEYKSLVLKEHAWALKYCVQCMKSSSAGLKAVTISLSVGQGLAESLVDLSNREENVASSPGLSYAADLLNFTCTAIRELFSWITQSLIRTKASQKTWSPVFVKALTLTTALANLTSARFKLLYPLADGLCGFLGMGIGSPESRSKALLALESIISNATSESCTLGATGKDQVEMLIVGLLPLLNTRDITDNREAISSLCGIISKSFSSDTATVGALLKGVNAFDSSKLNEPDYDRRIESLHIIIGCIKNALSGLDKAADGTTGDLLLPKRQHDVCKPEAVSCGPNAFSALLYGCLSAVRIDDTAVRGTAGYSLSLMAKWAGKCKKENGALPMRMFTVLVPTVASCKTMSVRREYCRSLGELVRCGSCNPYKFSDAEESRAQECNAEAIFSVMTGLANAADPDADFFENLVHLQPHRRGRALRQLAKHMKELIGKSLEHVTRRKAVESFASEFALSLGLNMALERSCSSEVRSSHRHRESREGAQKDVLNWAVELVGTSAEFLPWASYKSFLSSLLRRIKHEGDRENVNMLLKLLVSTSKVYPRPDVVGSPCHEESTNFLTSKIIPEMLSHVNSSAVGGEVLTAYRQALRSSKRNRPEKDAATFRAPIAVAAGELMTCLPAQNIDSHISLLIAPLSGALHSRVSGPREEAKKALTSVVLILGPKYLNYILNQVLNALKDGFRRDACVYVIYAVLTGIHDFCRGASEQGGERRSFPVDSACDLLVSFLIQELESGLGESRHDFADPNTSSERERQASRRALKSFECVELLAEHISFEDTAGDLVKPFLHSSIRSTSAKLSSKIRSALKHVVQGFSRNYSMQAEDALKICYAFTNWNGMAHEEEKANEMVDTFAADHQEYNGIESVNFGLQLLNVVISRNIESMKGCNERGRFLQSMCEPFLRLVVRAVRTGNDELSHTAFRSCQKLLKLPLSGRSHVADKLSETVVDVLAARSVGVSNHGNWSSGDELFNCCLRAGAVLLHEVGPKEFTVVSRERVEALVNISCNCLEHGCVDSRSAALALLRAVVSRRVMIPCVYDAMEKVNEMGIHSHSASLRKCCIGLSVGFLVSFPLGSKRVRQNLEFFVRNLNYGAASGRIAALQALETIITKFPCEALEDESEYLFVALAAAGARDTDGECRSRASECLKKLFEKWGYGRQTIELVRMGGRLAGVEWGRNEEDEDVKYCGGRDEAVQRGGILGLTAAGLSGQLKKKEIGMIGRAAVVVLKEAGRECGWETKYSVLRCIEACMESQSDGEREMEVDERMFWLWEEMGSLLIDKHEWVRISACRLVGRHLSRVGGREADMREWKIQKGWMWHEKEVIRNTMKCLCVELEASHLSMELGEQALKNVLCIAGVLRSQGCGVDDIDDDGFGRKLRWLVTRMSGIASRGGMEEGELMRRACGLRFLIVTGRWWGKWIMEKVGGLYIRAVVRVLESGELVNGKSGEDVIALGQKLQETILESMETDKYYAEYGRICGIRKWIKMKRKKNNTGAKPAKKRRRGKSPDM